MRIERQIGFIFIMNILLILIFSGMIISCAKVKDKKAEDMNNLMKVKAFTVKEELLVPEIKTFGTISYKTKADIYPKTTGRIENLNTEQGKAVHTGQILATLEQFQLKLELSQAQSELNASRSSLELAKAKYNDALKSIERQVLTIEKAKAELEDKANSLKNLENTLNNKKKLLEAGAVSEEAVRDLETQYHTANTQYILAERELKIQEIGFRDADIIENNYKVPSSIKDKIEIFKKINTQIAQREVEVADANYKIAENKVTSTQAYLNETYIRSPMEGIVAARYIERGEEAKSDTKLFTLMETRYVYAKINISEIDLVRVKPNGEVTLTVDALFKKSYTGKIELISPVIDTKTRTVELSVLVNNTNNELKPGMFTRAVIKSNEERKSIMIPSTALIAINKDKADVFIIKNSIAVKKTIIIGNENDNKVEVIEGLKDQDIIIDNPSINLMEGTKVELTSNTMD